MGIRPAGPRHQPYRPGQGHDDVDVRRRRPTRDHHRRPGRPARLHLRPARPATHRVARRDHDRHQAGRVDVRHGRRCRRDRRTCDVRAARLHHAVGRGKRLRHRRGGLRRGQPRHRHRRDDPGG
jgi:hypothetical protein